MPYIYFPEYKADGIPLTGHAGVLLIDNKTGYTKYYEYGRYNGDVKGHVRTYAVPNVVIKDGKPTEESFNTVLDVISSKSGHDGKIKGAYVESDNFDAMNDYAAEKVKEKNNEDRTPYNILKNNCGTFADDVIRQDKTVSTPSYLVPSPIVIGLKYGLIHTPIKYEKKR